MEVIGWLGSILFGICAVPQAWKTYRDGNAEGLSWTFLLLWLGGEVFTLIYIIPKDVPPLLLNYVLNLICLLIMLRYKLVPKRTPSLSP